MGKISTLLAGAAIGAGLMYLYGTHGAQQGIRLRRPLHGRRRRLLGRSAAGTAAATGPLRGLAAQMRAMRAPERTADDILAARVRSNLSRIVPGAPIAVTAHAGRATLRGSVAAPLVDRVLDSTRLVRGVERIDNQLEPLEPYESPDDPPESRGASPAWAS